MSRESVPTTMIATARPRPQRVLGITVGDDRTASSRVRTGAMLAFARLAGWETRRVVTGRAWPLRALTVLIFWRPDVVVVQKIALRAPIEALIRALSRELVLDLDDAIYLGYPGSEVEAPRYRKAVERMFAHADRCVVSNELIAEDLAAASRVAPLVFPGPAPEVAISRGEKAANSILWLGSPSTIAHVRSIAYPAVELDASLHLTVVGAPRDHDVGVNIHEVLWSQATADRELAVARVGLLPIVETSWSRRSAGYKVLQYLAHDIIPVAQDMPFLETLLKEHLPTLAVVVRSADPAQWLAAIREAGSRPIDPVWRAARDAVFDRLSIRRYTEAVLGSVLPAEVRR